MRGNSYSLAGSETWGNRVALFTTSTTAASASNVTLVNRQDHVGVYIFTIRMKNNRDVLYIRTSQIPRGIIEARQLHRQFKS
jgi:hypothetical protein